MAAEQRAAETTQRAFLVERRLDQRPKHCVMCWEAGDVVPSWKLAARTDSVQMMDCSTNHWCQRCCTHREKAKQVPQRVLQKYEMPFLLFFFDGGMVSLNSHDQGFTIVTIGNPWTSTWTSAFGTFGCIFSQWGEVTAWRPSTLEPDKFFPIFFWGCQSSHVLEARRWVYDAMLEVWGSDRASFNGSSFYGKLFKDEHTMKGRSLHSSTPQPATTERFYCLIV